jgi:hypothetical protein
MRQLLREYFPEFVALHSLADMDEYDDAVEQFARGGSQRDLMRRLLALGMTAAEIRWHAAYPGRRMMAVTEG